MADFEIGRLLRLEEAIKAAAAETEVDGASAPGLTESYMRLRTQVADLVRGSDLQGEFESTFPEIEVVEPPDAHPRQIGLALERGRVPARHAQSLLAQLAGWIAGLVREATLAEQMRLNAEEYAKEARKGPVGFHSGDAD